MKIILKQDLRTPTGKLKAGDEVIIVCDNDDLPLLFIVIRTLAIIFVLIFVFVVLYWLFN